MNGSLPHSGRVKVKGIVVPYPIERERISIIISIIVVVAPLGRRESGFLLQGRRRRRDTHLPAGSINSSNLVRRVMALVRGVKIIPT